MRFLTIGLLALLFSSTTSAQVRTALSFQAGSATKPPFARLTVVIDVDWHIASLTQPEGGPLRTTIEIPGDQPYRVAGKIVAPQFQRSHSEVFDVEMQIHEGTVDFLIPLEKNAAVKSSDDKKLVVAITYQACSGETCQLPKTERVAAQIP
jgi:suppressor for copper-sensitivity B